MQPFVFHNPTKIDFGAGKVVKAGKATAEFGKKALLVYGQNSLKKTGIFDRITASLKEAGVEYVEFGGVKSNPVLSHTQEGVELAKKENVDVILAAGGGSVLDEAKAIAAGALYDGDVWDFFIDKAKVEQALPLVTVLTLAATGSEMNCGGVVTNEKTQQKFNIFGAPLYPRTSILDPELTYSVPSDYTAYAGVDAISHLIEGYFTSTDTETPLQDRFVEGTVKVIKGATERLLRRGDDPDARANMMWASTLALNGLSTAGIGSYSMPNHMIEHSLSAMYDIHHGAGLSIVIPAWMAYQAERDPQKFARFANRVFRCSGGSTAERGLYASDAMREWFRKIGAPIDLSEGDIPAEDIPAIAENATMLAQKWGLEEYTKDVIIDILKRCD
ncbi:MAG: iron-containing alcohol dehydrogenase [Geobacteraceae bacterium]|nr:iron-containing alcohol dehydrogenase [Geobacteraceae bacterium]